MKKIQLSDLLKNRKDMIFGLIWIIVGLWIDLYYFFVYGKQMIDSDMSSELILAKILNDEGSITGFTNSWFYSTEFRALNIQYFFRIGFLFFPDNWYAARVTGMVIGLILLSVSVYFLFKKLGLLKAAPYAAAIVIFPGGSWYFWMTVYGGQYLPYLLISVFSMLCVLSVAEAAQKRKMILPCAVIVILGILSGMNGIKQLMIFYVPFGLAAFIFLLLLLRHAEKSEDRKKALRFIISSFAGIVSSGIGYIINCRILANTYSFRQYSNTVISDNNIWEYIKTYIWSFGFNTGNEFMSLKGIASMTGLVVGILTVTCGVRLLTRLEKTDSGVSFLTLVSLCIIVINVLVQAHVDKGGIQYFVAIVPYGLFLLVLEIASEDFRLKYSRMGFMNLLLAVMMIVSLGTVMNEQDNPVHPLRAKPEMEKVVDFLNTTGYSRGIATPWNANIVTELSDGRLDMWTITYWGDENPYEWLQRKDHIKNGLPTENYFVLFEKGEAPFEFFTSRPELVPIYEDENYYVFGTV